MSEAQGQVGLEVMGGQRKPRLLGLCDTPTEHTGFGRVAQQLLRRWAPHFERIDICGINYTQGPPRSPWDPLSEFTRPPFRVFPLPHPWFHPPHLQVFLDLLTQAPKDYTHVWMMQDLPILSANDFPACIDKVKRHFGVHFSGYLPVDAPVEGVWTRIVDVLDLPVFYTHYGREQAIQARRTLGGELPAWCHPANEDLIIPHGVDHSVFRVLPQADRQEARDYFRKALWPEDRQPEAGTKILVNVNQNSRRKALSDSLSILAELRKDYGDFRLVLHCPPRFDGIDLPAVGRQLGLVEGRDWMHTGALWNNANRPQMDDEWLNRLYNGADGLLTTTLGEGWGMSITEAAAAGCPVFAPEHTSCKEIAGELGPAVTCLPLSTQPVVLPDDNGRVRYPVDVAHAAWVINRKFEDGLPPIAPLAPSKRDWLSWDRIARWWLEKMGVVENDQTPNPKDQTAGSNDVGLDGAGSVY